MSGLAVMVSFPVSVMIPAPDLPGIVLVVSGGAASLLARSAKPDRAVQFLATMVVFVALMVGLHRLLHEIGVSHDWIEPVYVGAVGVYVAAVIFVSRRLFLRE